MKMQRAQGGFTLIELIMVIVILGILAATALPKFVDLSDEAEAAALQGVVGAANSAMAINYASCSAKSHTPGDKCLAVDNCQDVASLLIGGVLPSGYTVGNVDIGPGDPGDNGETEACTITQTSTTDTGTFQGISAGL